MSENDKITPAFPNRPDALGFFADSRVAEDPRAGYSQSRYAAALGRLVDRLLTKADTVKGEQVRGKRRNRVRPQERSNTVRTYLKALELFSYYSVAQYGRELEPREITTDVSMAFAKWMAGEGPGPDVRGMYVRSMGPDFLGLYEAVAKACSMYGQASIIQIIEQLPPTLRQRLVMVPADPREQINVSTAHEMMGKLVRAFRTIIRSPSSAEIRRSTREVWSRREQDAYTYRYAMAPRTSLATASVVTHLCSLSAVWMEMSKPSTPDEPPLAFNPWKDLYANWHWRMQREKKNAAARGENKVLTTPMANAMLNACVGAKMEHRRDAFAIAMLLFMGVRAEELAGLLRSDLRDQSGQLSVNVLGKGNKVRNVPLEAMARDALMLLNAKLEDHSIETEPDEEGLRVPSYRARYCRALLKPEAPLVPSLIRWGCFVKPDQERVPEKDALNCLDTSGVRALVQKISDRARVKVIASGEIRGFTDEEKTRVHPHAFRHYAATAAKESGLDLTEIKLILGHDSVTTTESYISVPTQVSSAFSAGIYQTLKRRGPLTPEQLVQARRTALSPLDDPTIVEWEPDIPVTPAASKAIPLSEVERRTIIESPSWAYERPDVDSEGKMPNYLPYGTPARKFSSDLKRREAEAERAIEQARASGDAQGYAQSVQLLADIRARHLWNTFHLGRLSKLPWWAGRANRWTFEQMAPVISYAQVAPENTADSALVVQLRRLHDEVYRSKGPTAATAVIAWLGEMLDIAGVQFARVMNERQDVWIPFEAQSAPDAGVVREHLPERIVDWFSRHGTAIHATGYKSAKNRGNIALLAMDTLPDWMWVADPLADPKFGLPRSERAQLRDWIEALQATRPSRMRLDQWIDQMTVRMTAWARKASEWQDRNGKPWAWAPAYADRDAWTLASQALDMGNEFDEKFPKEFERVDVAAMCLALPSPIRDVDARAMITGLLTSKGVDAGDPTRARMTPVMRLRAGAKHMFDPALLTFNTDDTIVHDEQTRRWWYERYGTDSECVTRRALRTLWSRRKASARAQHHQLLARHFDLQLSAIIPCAAEIEERVRKAGWTAPTTIEETVRVSKIMWMGLTDYARQQQGAQPVEQIPADVAETFWSTELPDIVQLVEQHSPDVVTVTDGEPGAEEAIEELAAKQPPAPEVSVADPFEPPPEPTWEPAKVDKPLMDYTDQEWADLEARVGDLGGEALPTAEPEQQIEAVKQRARKARAKSKKQVVKQVEAQVRSELEAQREQEIDPAVFEQELKSFEQSKAEERRRKAEEQNAVYAARYFDQQAMADVLAQSAVKEGYTKWLLHAETLWSMLDASDAKLLAFATTPGDVQSFSMKFLRKVREVIQRFNPVIWWDGEKAYLRLRWREGRAGLNLRAWTAPMIRSMQDKLKRERKIRTLTKTEKDKYSMYVEGPAVVVQLWKAAELTPNAQPRWLDPSPWAPRWPNYPMPDPQDVMVAEVAELPWPRDPVGRPLHSLMFNACMQQYQEWKRDLVPTEGMIPNGWQPGQEQSLALRGELPHPVDFAFAIVRSG